MEVQEKTSQLHEVPHIVLEDSLKAAINVSKIGHVLLPSPHLHYIETTIMSDSDFSVMASMMVRYI